MLTIEKIEEEYMQTLCFLHNFSVNLNCSEKQSLFFFTKKKWLGEGWGMGWGAGHGERSLEALVCLGEHFPNTKLQLHYSSWQETTCGLFPLTSKKSLAFIFLFPQVYWTVTIKCLVRYRKTALLPTLLLCVLLYLSVISN